MRAWWIALGLMLAACDSGQEAAPAPKQEQKAPEPPKPAPATKQEPEGRGKNLCLKCSIRTDAKSCPKCKAVLESTPAVAPAAGTGHAGQSTMAPRYACPKPGCDYTDPSKGTCLKHPDTQMLVQWFVCAKCSVREPVAGKCPTCGGALGPKLE